MAAALRAGHAFTVPGIFPHVIPAVGTTWFALLVMQVGAVGTDCALRLCRALGAVQGADRAGATHSFRTRQLVVTFRAVQLAGAVGGQVRALLALCADFRPETSVAGRVANLANTALISSATLVVAIWALVVAPVRMRKVLAILTALACRRVRAHRAILRAHRACAAHLAVAVAVVAIGTTFVAHSRRCQVLLVAAFRGVGVTDASLHVLRAGRTGVAYLLDAVTIGAIRAGVLALLLRCEERKVLTQRALLLTEAVEARWRTRFAKAPDVLRAFEMVAVGAFVLTGTCRCEIRGFCTFCAHIRGLAKVAW